MTESVFSRLFDRQQIEGRFFGVVVGIVTNNEDPDSLHRVKVRFPWLSAEDESHWARVATPMAGNDRGLYFLPEVDDEVLVAFEHGRPDRPIVIGSLWNGQDAPPEDNGDGGNNQRTLRSRSGHVIRFDDSDGAEKIEIIDTTENQRVVIDSSANTILVEADSDITLRSKSGKVIVEAQQGIEMTTQAGVKVDGSQNVDVSAGAQVNVKGSLVNIN